MSFLNNYYRRIKRIVTRVLPVLFEKYRNPKSVYWVYTPEHGNLGDHAIAQAEKMLFEKCGIETIELTGEDLKYRLNHGLLQYMNGKCIFVHGGGFLGSIWPESESLLRSIIKLNPRSRILVFPNTVYYDPDDTGKKDMEESVRIYGNHPRLTIYCRESISYSLAKKLYKDVKLIPDMAMMMDYSDDPLPRKGCVLSLRSDIEKTRSDQDDNAILSAVSAIFGPDISYHDMNVGHSIPIENRDAELKKQYDIFKSAELVITDRLHGMIFCAITGTPCIVINSKSPKVKGCYEWLKSLNYIRFCDDTAAIGDVYASMQKGSQKYDNSHLLPYYEKFAKDIIQAVKSR